MKDRELNEILKRASVPEREAGYWERFPCRVTAEIERRRQDILAERNTDGPARSATGWGGAWWWASSFRFLGTKPALAVGLAAVCLTLGFLLGFWKGHSSPGDNPQLAEARKYYRELEGLFPNQLQAIVFDQKGTHLFLAREPSVPASPPLYLKVCGPKGCQSFVTFSGQQIRINGDTCDVLADGRGEVLLVGRQLVWAGLQSRRASGRYQIEAKPLEATL